jgi:hypothetical protein
MNELQTPRELALREADGVEVALLWHPTSDAVSVMVVDSRSGDRFELVLDDHESPLDVFHHPYAHAARRGLALRAHRPERELVRSA